MSLVPAAGLGNDLFAPNNREEKKTGTSNNGLLSDSEKRRQVASGTAAPGAYRVDMDGTPKSAISKKNTKDQKRTNKKDKKSKDPSPRRLRLVLYAILGIVIVAAAVGAAFFFFGRSKDEPITDNSPRITTEPPSSEVMLYEANTPKVCEAISDGNLVEGQDGFIVQDFDLKLDISLDAGTDINAILPELMQKMQQNLAPAIAGCSEDGRRLLELESSIRGRRLTLSFENIIANFVLKGIIKVDEECSEGAEEPCYRIVVTCKCYLKGDALVSRIERIIESTCTEKKDTFLELLGIDGPFKTIEVVKVQGKPSTNPPASEPSKNPTKNPTKAPIVGTYEPTVTPTSSPTKSPTTAAVATCKEQFPCLDFSIEILDSASCEGTNEDCKLRVCMNIDINNENCQKEDAISHVCDTADFQGCPNSGFLDEPKFDSGSDVHTDCSGDVGTGDDSRFGKCEGVSEVSLCQEGSPGDSLYFVVKDGNDSTSDMDPVEFDAGDSSCGGAIISCFNAGSTYASDTITTSESSISCGGNTNLQLMERVWKYEIPSDYCATCGEDDEEDEQDVDDEQDCPDVSKFFVDDTYQSEDGDKEEIYIFKCTSEEPIIMLIRNDETCEVECQGRLTSACKDGDKISILVDEDYRDEVLFIGHENEDVDGGTLECNEDIMSLATAPPTKAPVPGQTPETSIPTCYKCDGKGACTEGFEEQVDCGSCINEYTGAWKNMTFNSDLNKVGACHFAKGEIGSQSCLGISSCAESLAVIGTGSCLAPFSCTYSTGTINTAGETLERGSCFGGFSCFGSSAAVASSSCRGHYSCFKNTGSTGPLSCYGHGACANREVELGMRSCMGNHSCSVPPKFVEDFGKLIVKGENDFPACQGPYACVSMTGLVNKGSCRGRSSCSGRTKVQVGPGSCVGTFACRGYWDRATDEEEENPPKPVSSLTIAMRACVGNFSCVGAIATVGAGSCHNEYAGIWRNATAKPEYKRGGACRGAKGQIGAQSCLAGNSCARSNSLVGPGSCIGAGACDGASGTIGGDDVEDGSCRGGFSCANSTALVKSLSCRGISSCRKTDGSIGSMSCNGHMSCSGRTLEVTTNTCHGPYACFFHPRIKEFLGSASKLVVVGDVDNHSCDGKRSCLSIGGKVGLGSCQGEAACFGRKELNIGKNSCIGKGACLGLFGSENPDSFTIPTRDLTVGVGSCQCEKCCICMETVGDGKCNTLGECCMVDNPLKPVNGNTAI